MKEVGRFPEGAKSPHWKRNILQRQCSLSKRPPVHNEKDSEQGAESMVFRKKQWNGPDMTFAAFFCFIASLRKISTALENGSLSLCGHSESLY